MSKRFNKAIISTRFVRLSAIALAVSTLTTLMPAQASSHRETAFVASTPKVDNTNSYILKSYEAGHSAITTVIANYVPQQDAFGGPNYFAVDQDAMYKFLKPLSTWLDRK
jgi:Domain of unknown function (DUF4331)